MRITSAAGFSKAKEMEDRILRAGADTMKTWVESSKEYKVERHIPEEVIGDIAAFIRDAK